MITYAKFNDAGQIIFCPRNGYLGNVPISNIHIYFNEHPDVAKAEGWYPVKFLDEPVDNFEYKLIDGVIYEVEI